MPAIAEQFGSTPPKIAEVAEQFGFTPPKIAEVAEQFGFTPPQIGATWESLGSLDFHLARTRPGPRGMRGRLAVEKIVTGAEIIGSVNFAAPLPADFAPSAPGTGIAMGRGRRRPPTLIESVPSPPKLHVNSQIQVDNMHIARHSAVKNRHDQMHIFTGES